MTETRALIDMDHLMCAAADAPAARERLTALGFTVTPFSEVQSMGGGNQLVLFQARTPGLANYLEFITTLDASKVPPPLQPLFVGLAQGGLSIVHGVADAGVYTARALELGMKTLPPMPLARDWRLDDETLNVRFTVAIPLPGQSPLMFNACRHDTLEHFQRPSWTTHRNSIARLSRVLAISSAPDRDVMLLAAMHAREPAPGAYAKLALHGPEVVIEVLDAAEAARLGATLEADGAARLFGIELEARSIDQARAMFEAAGCALKRSGDGFYAGPDDACGLTMIVAPSV